MGPRRRRVVWTENARQGIDSSIAVVAEESIERAWRVLDRILGAAESLETLSERGSRIPEFGTPDLRQILVKPYRLLYRVTSSEIIILGLLHQRQDIQRWRNRDTDASSAS